MQTQELSFIGVEFVASSSTYIYAHNSRGAFANDCITYISDVPRILEMAILVQHTNLPRLLGQVMVMFCL